MKNKIIKKWDLENYKHIKKEKYNDLLLKSEEVGKLLNYMMNNPDKFK